MKTILQLLASMALSGAAIAQTAAVTKNATTNAVNGGLVITGTNTLTVNGTLRTGTPTVLLDSTAGINFGTVGSALLVTGKNRHAILARTPNATDGIALAGWSSSGASAVKAMQDTYFTSPAITVWRDTSLGGALTDSPGVLVAVTGIAPASTHRAVEVTNQGASKFKITWDGDATSRGFPLIRWRGVATGLPTDDLKDGDMCFILGPNKIYIRANATWIMLN